MLNQVPIQVMRSARMVTLRHPNGMDCTLYRKTVNRLPTDTPNEMGGLPTIEGVGVLNAEDEPDYTYSELGAARIVFTGQFQPQVGNMMDNDTSILYHDPAPVEALVECLAEPDAPEYFTPDKNDMVTVYPGNGVVVSYMIADVTGNIAIPPYTRKYLLQPMQDASVGI